MKIEYPSYGLERSASVEEALGRLSLKPRYGLLHSISFEPAKKGCTFFNQRVDYWIHSKNEKVPLRVEKVPSRPKRRYLKKLIGPNAIPTLLVYANIGMQALTRKVAKCIKLGLDKMRRLRDYWRWLKKHPDLAITMPELDEPAYNPYSVADRSDVRMNFY